MTNCSSLDSKAHNDDGGSNIVDLIPNPTSTTENDPTEYLLSRQVISNPRRDPRPQ